MHFFDAQQDSDEEELQDAIATSHALVGESVVDSPNAPFKEKLKIDAMTAPPLPPDLSSDSSSKGGGSVGLVASGLAWVQKQRESRRRRYLHDQAEKQLRKF